MKRIPLFLFICLLLPALAACGDYGKVDQGRVVAVSKDPATSKVTAITMIRESLDSSKPGYVILPPVSYKTPADPKEMGPEPQPGLRMKLDVDAKSVTLFDPPSGQFKVISYVEVDRQNGVAANSPILEGRKLPAVDKDKKTVTIYSPPQKVLVAIQVPDEYLGLPPESWNQGDEVRIYFKQEGQAMRLMNVTRTDIFKK